MRLYALVEGKAESRFVSTVLAPHLSSFGVGAYPIQVRTSATQRRGLVSFDHVKRDMRDLLNRHQGGDVRFTTMFDFYNLPTRFRASRAKRTIRVRERFRLKTRRLDLSAISGSFRICSFTSLRRYCTLPLVCWLAASPA